MDHKDWVLQDGKDRVNCSGFPCLWWNISVSHPFLHAGCQRLFIAECSKVVSWSRTLMATSQLKIECVTSCITVMVIYYLWSTTIITTLLSSFIWWCLVILPLWVTWMTDTKHLLGHWLYHTDQDNYSELLQILHQQWYLHPHISSLSCPLVVDISQQGPISVMTLP